MAKAMPRRPRGAILGGLLVGGALLLGGCTGNGNSGNGTEGLPDAPPPPEAEIGERIPEGAVPVGEALYMIPVGVTDDGYHQYTPHSTDPDRAVTTLIHYPDGEGGFTPDRSQAVRGPAE